MFGNPSGLGTGLFDEFRRLEQELDQLFAGTQWPLSIRSAAQGAFPPLNVGTSPESVDVYVFAAGLDPRTLDVSLRQNLLTVSGERKPHSAEEAAVYRRERFTGVFQRVITLPEDIDPEQVEAQYRNGVLHVSVRRREASRPRQIEVS
jgi:HSP20 family protein